MQKNTPKPIAKKTPTVKRTKTRSQGKRYQGDMEVKKQELLDLLKKDQRAPPKKPTRPPPPPPTTTNPINRRSK